MRPAIIIAMLLAVGPASAETANQPWSIGARSSYLVIGSKRPTGGLMPQVEGLYSWQVSDAVRVLAGGEFGVTVDAPRWMAILGGPVGAVATRPWSAPVELRLAAHSDFGRLPTCNAWGLCMLYSGWFPAGSFAVTYAPSPHVAAGADVCVRAVSTLGWSGAALCGGVNGTFRW